MVQPIEYGAAVRHKIRKVRELRSLTQEKVAEELGMTTSGCSRIERGVVKLSLSRLEQIAGILGVQSIDLTNLDETIFFTNYGTAQDHSFSVTTDGDAMRHERATYEARIADLKGEIAFLRALLGVRSVDLAVAVNAKCMSGRGPARPTATKKGKRPPKTAASSLARKNPGKTRRVIPLDDPPLLNENK